MWSPKSRSPRAGTRPAPTSSQTLKRTRVTENCMLGEAPLRPEKGSSFQAEKNRRLRLIRVPGLSSPPKADQHRRGVCYTTMELIVSIKKFTGLVHSYTPKVCTPAWGRRSSGAQRGLGPQPKADSSPACGIGMTASKCSRQEKKPTAARYRDTLA